MDLLFKKLLRIAIAMFLALALTFTHASYAANDSSNIAGGELLLVGGGILAAGAAIPALIALFIKHSTTPSITPITPTPTPTPPVIYGPVISSASNHNFLSYNGGVATGTITVNNYSNVAQKFSITSVSDLLSLVAANTDCTAPAATSATAPGTCTFNITYPAHPQLASTPVISPVNFRVVDESGNSDAITVNMVDMTTNDPANGDFFDPSIYDTKATGLPYTSNTLVTVTKNNFNFLYAAVNNNNINNTSTKRSSRATRTISNNNSYNSSNSGVFRSSDDGKTWSPVNNGLLSSNLGITSLCLMNSTLFINTYGNNGVFSSTDGGESWQPVAGLNNYQVNVLYCSSNDVLYASIYGGILQSTDGINWTTITPKIWVHNITLLSSTPNPSNPLNDILYAIDSYGYFYTGTFDGTNWNWSQPVQFGVTMYSIYATGSNLYVGGQNEIAWNNNYGDPASWAPSTIPSGDTYNYNIQNFCSIGGNLYAGTVGQTSSSSSGATIGGTGILMSSDNGNTWNQFNGGLMSTDINIYALYPDLTNNRLFTGTDVGIFAILNPNTTTSWTQISYMLAMQVVQSLSAVGNDLYAGLSSGFGVFKSTDGGANWAAVNNGLINTYVNALCTIGNTLFAGTEGNGVFSSANGGISWSATGAELANQNIQALFSDSSGNLYAGTDGTINYGVYVSSDQGATWPTTGLQDESVTTFSSDNTTTVYTAVYDSPNNIGDVYSSTYGGSDWKYMSTIKSPVQALYFNNSTLYAGTTEGMFSSIPGKLGWNPDANWPAYVDAYDIYASNNILYASSVNYGGVYYKNPTSGMWQDATGFNEYYDYMSAYVLYSINDGLHNNLYVGTYMGVLKNVQ